MVYIFEIWLMMIFAGPPGMLYVEQQFVVKYFLVYILTLILIQILLLQT